MKGNRSMEHNMNPDEDFDREYAQDDFETMNQNEANDYRHEYDDYDNMPEDPERDN